MALNEDKVRRDGKSEAKVYSPQEISERVGGISVNSLTAVIRKAGLETTTIGHAEPSKRGGPSRRVWGMTEAQLERLLHFRNERSHGSKPSRGAEITQQRRSGR